MDESAPKTSEELAKTKYFSTFALRHMSEMRQHAKSGTLGPDSWRNISEHCLVEAVAGSLLARGVGADEEKISKALLLHDWYKRREVEGRRPGISIDESNAKSKEELLAAGAEPDVVELIDAIIPESVDEAYVARRSLAEKIIHWMDLSTQDNRIIDFHERIRKAEESPVALEYSESKRALYGGKSLNEFDAELAAKDQAEFEAALGIEPGTLIEWLNKTLAKEVAGNG